MKYSNTIVTQPVRSDATTEVHIDGYGDSMFISLDYEIPSQLHLPDPQPISVSRFPSVYIEEVGKHVGAVHKMGEDLVFTLKLTEARPTDITVDYTITSLAFTETDYRKSDKVVAHVDTSDYSRYFLPVDLLLVEAPIATVTIPAGQLSVDVTVTTTANTVMLYGEGSYFTSNIALSNLSDPQMMLHPEHQNKFVLSEDAISYPAWGDLEVEVWGKLPEVSYYQPIIDPETSQTVTFTFGFDEVDDGLGNITLTDTVLRSKIIDDIPLDSIQFRPVEGSLPVDKENVTTPVDLTNSLPFYVIKVTTGRRD